MEQPGCKYEYKIDNIYDIDKYIFGKTWIVASFTRVLCFCFVIYLLGKLTMRKINNQETCKTANFATNINQKIIEPVYTQAFMILIFEFIIFIIVQIYSKYKWFNL